MNQPVKSIIFINLFGIFETLKKAAAISFLLVFLFANTELKQLLKLPVLIHHYIEHHKDDAGKSLLAFLHEHYAEEHTPSTSSQHHANDHQNLPFKSHHTGISQIPVFCSLSTGFDCTLESILPVTVKNHYTEQSHYPSALSRIWQPPRAC